MYLDVMGKVQIVAKCDDVKALYDAAYVTEEEAEEYEDLSEKKAYEKYIAGINETYSITVHYDGKKTVQAIIELEVMKDTYEDYYGDSRTEYYVEPVLVFAKDNSRYTFEEYFKERDFRYVVEAAEELAEEFEELFEDYYY